METLSRISSAVKDTYAEAAEWVSAHPHLTIWSALAAIVLVAVF